MRFSAKGHPNIRATHKTTIEFTKEKEMHVRGDCIVGVDADFDTDKLKEFVQQHDDVRILIKVEDISEEIYAKTNKIFADEKEIVIRMGEHASTRTFAVRADKAAKHLNREMIERLQQGAKIEVQIEPVE